MPACVRVPSTPASNTTLLLLEQLAVAAPDGRQLLGRGLLAGRGGDRVGLGLLHQARDADLEELVHVAGEDGQELDPLQERVAPIARLEEHAAVELEGAQLAVDVAGTPNRPRRRGLRLT